MSDNVGFTVFWFVVTFLCVSVTDLVKKRLSPFNYQQTLNKIKKQHPILDQDELKNQLKIKKMNYEIPIITFNHNINISINFEIKC